MKILNYYLVIICLQEVPGDLLNLIYQLSQDNKLKIYYYKLPRKPSIKVYKDNFEYLVTIIYNINSKNNIINNIQYSDYGKAALIVFIESINLCCINTHLPIYNYDGKDSIDLLSEYINYYDNCLLVGDFNKDYYDVLLDLQYFNIYNLLNSFTGFDTYTYKKKNYNGNYNYKRLDHMFTFSKIYRLKNSCVYDNNISDHCLIYSKLVKYD